MFDRSSIPSIADMDKPVLSFDDGRVGKFALLILEHQSGLPGFPVVFTDDNVQWRPRAVSAVGAEGCMIIDQQMTTVGERDPVDAGPVIRQRDLLQRTPILAAVSRKGLGDFAAFFGSV